MPVEFTIPNSELRQAIEQLKANRGTYSDTDFVDIVISESSALFHAVGTESEAAVNGTAAGNIRVPLRVIDKIAGALSTMKQEELTVHCVPGLIRVGKFSVKHDDIELGKAPAEFETLPINLPLLDTLAVARVFSSKKIDDQGLRSRVNEAEHSRRSAVYEATKTLQALEISEQELTFLVERHIRAAVERLRKSLRAA
ncbi:MAG TPA: hypothetical protein VGS02_10985 [Acidobacteriaceae bacterium]|nr:hypothetical protein [Acidobacteriaceae bacterium]